MNKKKDPEAGPDQDSPDTSKTDDTATTDTVTDDALVSDESVEENASAAASDDDGPNDPAGDSAVDTDPEPTQPDEIADPHDDHAEHSGSSFASTALMLLVGALVVAGLALWGAPKLAPHLPGSIAKYLQPIPGQAQAEIDRLTAQLAEVEGALGGLPDLSARLDALEAENGAAASNEIAETAIASATAASDSVGEMSGRMTEMADQVAALESEVRAFAESLTSGEEDVEGVPAVVELRAALQALQSRVDTLAASASVLPDLVSKSDADAFATDADLAAAQSTLSEQIAAVAAQAEAAKVTGNDALVEAQTAVKSAALRGAATTLKSRVLGGLAFSGALTEVETLSGTAPPEALAAAAGSGIATATQVASAFPSAAREALDADRRANAGDGVSNKVLSWLGSQVSTRPTVPTEGEGVPEILSRAEASLKAGDLSATQAEIASLPDHARAAMADWVASVEQKIGAQSALEDYLSAVGGAG